MSLSLSPYPHNPLSPYLRIPRPPYPPVPLSLYLCCPPIPQSPYPYPYTPIHTLPEAVDVVLEEVHLLTTIACHLATCHVMVDDDRVDGRTDMVNPGPNLHPKRQASKRLPNANRAHQLRECA